jgi:hypothetical protein
MTRKGEDVKCPRCGGQARVVWVSQDGKTAAIKCMGYHSHSEMGPSKLKRKLPKEWYFSQRVLVSKGSLSCRSVSTAPRLAIIHDVSSYFSPVSDEDC